jgi:hypothetical protein
MATAAGQNRVVEGIKKPSTLNIKVNGQKPDGLIVSQGRLLLEQEHNREQDPDDPKDKADLGKQQLVQESCVPF